MGIKIMTFLFQQDCSMANSVVFSSFIYFRWYLKLAQDISTIPNTVVDDLFFNRLNEYFHLFLQRCQNFHILLV